jgi:heme exporter protein D
MDLGPHASFIVASYAVVAVVMAGLVAWLVLDGRRHRRALEALEAQGIRRRSQQSGSTR